MDLLGIGTRRAVDAGIVDAGEHEHLVVGLVAETAGFTYFTHGDLI